MLKNILALTIVSLSLCLSQGASAQPFPSKGNPDELKINLGKHLVDQILSDSSDLKMLRDIYGDRNRPEDIVDALNAYMKALASPSRFDESLKGKSKALTPEEKKGYELFKSYGCAACHNGNKFGGSQFKKMGAAKNYFVERKTMVTPADLGLYEVTRNTKDLNVFKVPSLRNVSISAPYYHDGSVKTLDEAVFLMGKYQLGVVIPDADIKLIVAFLNTLTANALLDQPAR